MSGTPRVSGEAFAVERLREDPDLDYAALRRVADAAGITMQPIQYGRARKQLGLPPLQARIESRSTQPPTAIDEATPEASEPEGSEPEASEPEASEVAESPEAAAEAAEPEEAAAPDESGESEREAGAADAAADAGPGQERAADIVAPRRKGSAAFDFLVQELRRDGTLAYGAVRASAEARGFRIAPIMYGRAKAVLGLVPVKARGQGAKKAAAAAAAGVPRVLKQVESVAADRFARQLEEVRSLDQLVSVVKELDAERRRLRSLLDRIVAMIDEALG